MPERSRIPFIDLLNFIGLNTKSSNEIKNDLSVVQSDNTDLFRVYGAVSKPYGSSRVLNAVKNNDGGSPAKISWIGAWKIAGLNGQTDRQVLCAAATALYKVSSGTLTALTGSGKTITEAWIEGLFHMSQIYRDLMFITNQDPDLIGHGNTLVKYDGNEITRWGLLGPANEPNVDVDIQTVGATPPVGPNSTWIPTNGTAVADTVTTRDGYAISLTKTSVASTSCYIEQWLPTGVIPNDFHADCFSVNVFIPLGELIKLSTSAALLIKMVSTSQVSSGITIPDFATTLLTWSIPIGELFEGWNTINLGTSDVSTDINFDKRVVVGGGDTVYQGVRLGFNSLTNATLPAGIRFSQLRSFTRGNLTSANGASGAIFTSGAVYSYKVTFVTKQGFESNAGPKSADLTLTAGRAAITLTAIPVSNDPQVIARKLYRTVGDGSIWIYLDRIENNTTTTYSDVIGDTSLGESTPPDAGDVSIDHSPPPTMGIIKLWRRTMFGAGDPSNPNSVYYSDVDECEAWPTLNLTTLDAKVTAIYEAYSALIIETELGKWQVTGDNPDFRFDKIITRIGCVGRRAAGETLIEGWAIDRDGMRLYDANNPVKITEPIRDKFEDFNKSYIETSHSMHSKFNNAIIMSMCGATTTSFNADNYVYQFPVDEVGQGWWWQLKLPTSVNILDFAEVEDDNGDFHIYFGSDDGMIYELFDRNSKNWATATSSEAITTTIKTKWLRLGQLGAEADMSTGRVSPRMIEMITDGDACTWTVTIETATGPGQTTATSSTSIPVVFGDANERLMRYPIKNTLQPGEYIRITATQGTANVSSRILTLRLYFHVQPGQFPVETGDFNADI